MCKLILSPSKQEIIDISKIFLYNDDTISIFGTRY